MNYSHMSEIQRNTELLKSATTGNLDSVNALLAAGANKDAQHTSNETPLFMAASEGHTAIVERLLAAGANKDAETKNKATPLFMAASKGHTAIVDLLLAAGANKDVETIVKETPLMIAAFKGHTEIVDHLLAAGANKDAESELKFTALMCAAIKGHNAIVDLLLAVGADKDAENTHKETPLFMAAEKGYTEIVDRLLAAGANKDVENTHKQTPLFFAAFKGHTEIVGLLIAAGANKDVEDINKTTPLIIAAEKGYTEIVDRLLAAGANKDAEDKYNQTSLFVAAWKGHTTIVDRLLAAGANKDTENINKKTPLFVAAQEGHTEIVKRLLEAGADPTVKEKAGKTAFDISKEKGHIEITRLLSPKWKGFSRSDIDALNSIFETEGAKPQAVNVSCCPVCFKVVGDGQVSIFEVERSEACRYMKHNCITDGGYYHKDLYTKYKNPDGKITWCTVCGRICTGHRHHKLVLAKDPKSDLLPAVDPFNTVVVRNAAGHPQRDAVGNPITKHDPDGACKLEGGGGLLEKLARYRRMREFVLQLQKQIGKITFDDAVNKLVVETWNAPLFENLNLPSITSPNTWNIPSERFLELVKNANKGDAANVPWSFEGHPDMMPILSAPGGENDFTRVDIEGKGVQLRHRKSNGVIVTHPKIDIHTLFVDGVFGLFVVAGAPNFGTCFFYECGGILYPGELQYIIDNSRGAGPGALTDEKYEEYNKKIAIYRRVFNEFYRDNAAFRTRVNADIEAARGMAMGGAGGAGAGAGAGQGGGRRRSRKHRNRRKFFTRR